MASPLSVCSMPHMCMHTHTHTYIHTHTQTHTHTNMHTLHAVICGISRMRTWDMAMLQCVTVCCSVLQCVAVCCSVLQCASVCCSVLQCVAMVCRDIHMCNMTAMHYVAVPCSVGYYSFIHGTWLCCSVLQCVAVCSVVISYIRMRNMTTLQYVAVSCSVLQCVAVSCHAWQCAAVCGSIFQRASVNSFRELTHPYAGHDSLISKNVHVTLLVHTYNLTRPYVGHDHWQPTIRLQAKLSSHKKINRMPWVMPFSHPKNLKM